MAKTNEGVAAPRILQPPHNLHLSRKTNSVKCRVDLYKIPPKCINFEPTKTHFYLDTLKFTKKYLLEIPYPEGVEVDTNVEASFDSGVLTCSLPIVSDPNRPKDYEDMIEAREKIKEMRKKGIAIPESIQEKAQLKAGAQSGKQDNTEMDQEEEEEKEKQVRSAHKSDKKAMEKKAEASNKSKGIKRHKTDSSNNEGEGKNKVAIEVNGGNTDEQSNQKKAKVDHTQKKKNFLNDTAAALEVAEEVNALQEKQIQEKLDKEYAKLSFETRRRIESKEKKRQIKEMRNKAAEEASLASTSKKNRKVIK